MRETCATLTSWSGCVGSFPVQHSHCFLPRSGITSGWISPRPPDFKEQELSKKLSFCLCTSRDVRTQSVPWTHKHTDKGRDTHGPTHARRATLGPTQIPCRLSSSSKDILGNRGIANLGTIKPSKKQMSVHTHTHSHPHSGRHGDQSIFLVMASWAVLAREAGFRIVSKRAWRPCRFQWTHTSSRRVGPLKRLQLLSKYCLACTWGFN